MVVLLIIAGCRLFHSLMVLGKKDDLYTWVVLRKRVPKCDIELFALDLLVLVAIRLVQCATYTV